MGQGEGVCKHQLPRAWAKQWTQEAVIPQPFWPVVLIGKAHFSDKREPPLEECRCWQLPPFVWLRRWIWAGHQWHLRLESRPGKFEILKLFVPFQSAPLPPNLMTFMNSCFWFQKNYGNFPDPATKLTTSAWPMWQCAYGSSLDS